MLNTTNFSIQFPTNPAGVNQFLATNDIARESQRVADSNLFGYAISSEASTRYTADTAQVARITVLEAKPAGMVNPWTNNVDGGGWTLSDVNLADFSEPDTNSATTNQIIGTVRWSPTPTPAFTNITFGASNWNTYIVIQAGTNMSFRLQNGTNYIDGASETETSTNGLASQIYVDAATNTGLAAAQSYTDSATNNVLVSANSYANSIGGTNGFTNGVTGWFDGQINGSNGVYFTQGGNNYWIVHP